jgi:hypothetical protein
MKEGNRALRDFGTEPKSVDHGFQSCATDRPQIGKQLHRFTTKFIKRTNCFSVADSYYIRLPRTKRERASQPPTLRLVKHT